MMLTRTTLAFALCLGSAAPALAQSKDVSAEQYVAGRVARTMKADADGDGKLSPDEWAKARANSKGDPARSFQKTDADSNGFITPDELKTTAQKRFDKLDANHDGTLSQEEAHPKAG